MISGREEMPSRTEVRSDDSVHFDKVLGVSRGFEPSHAPLPLTRRLVRVLRTVVQFVGDDHARFVSRGPQQLAKESDRGKPIPPRLYKDVKNNAVLIDRSPKVMSDAVDFQEDLVQVPLVTGSSTPSPESGGILPAELVAPAPDRLIGEHDSGRAAISSTS